MFPAHIRECAHGTEIQTAAQHSKNTAAFAARLLREIGL